MANTSGKSPTTGLTGRRVAGSRRRVHRHPLNAAERQMLSRQYEAGPGRHPTEADIDAAKKRLAALLTDDGVASSR